MLEIAAWPPEGYLVEGKLHESSFIVSPLRPKRPVQLFTHQCNDIDKYEEVEKI